MGDFKMAAIIVVDDVAEPNNSFSVHCDVEGLLTGWKDASRVRWREAWEIAVKWARRGLKSLRESTVRRAFAEVTRLLAREEGDEGGEASGYVPRGSHAGPSSSPSGR
ncbi:unnamed protein product [Leuciscus chuanchicus]